MKAEPLMIRNAHSRSSAHAVEETACDTCEFEAGVSAVFEEPVPISAITDLGLATAAYSQAVALYNSCVQYAAATPPTNNPAAV